MTIAEQTWLTLEKAIDNNGSRSLTYRARHHNGKTFLDIDITIIVNGDTVTAKVDVGECKGESVGHVLDRLADWLTRTGRVLSTRGAVIDAIPVEWAGVGVSRAKEPTDAPT